MIAPPLTDTSPEGLRRAIEADTIGTRLRNSELPIELVHEEPDADWGIALTPDALRNVVASARFDAASADRRISEIRAAYLERGAAFVWWRAPFHSPGDLGERLERAGIVRVGTGPAMAIDLRDLPGPEPAPAGVEIRGVTDEAGHRAYLAVLGSEPPPGGTKPLFRPEIVEAMIGAGRLRMPLEPRPMRYVAWVDGEPVATSRLSLTGGTAGIYAVQTLPAFRGRGIGRAMTLAALHVGRELGYRIGTLQSTEAGFGIYRRIGFEEVFRYEIRVGNVPG